MKAQKTGSRFLYEPFNSGQNRVEIIERVSEEKWAMLCDRLDRIETQVAHLDRRLWAACFGVAMVILLEAVQSILIHGG